MAIWYPGYQHVHVRVRSTAIKIAFARGWGFVTDSFILHSRSLENQFVLFNNKDTLNVVSVSHQEALIVQKCDRVRAPENSNVSPSELVANDDLEEMIDSDGSGIIYCK